MWVNHAIMRTPLCFSHEVVDYLRNIARGGDWEGSSPANGEVVNQMASLQTSALAACLYHGERGAETTKGELWSDASTTGLGAVWDYSGSSQLWRVACAFPNTAIFAAELLGGFLGSKALVENNMSFKWTTDNEAASRALRRGHSASKIGDPPKTVRLVPTECNISDPASRGHNYVGGRCDHTSHYEGPCRWRPPT